MYRAQRGYIRAHICASHAAHKYAYLYKRQVHALPFMNIPHGGIFYCTRATGAELLYNMCRMIDFLAIMLYTESVV